MIHVAERVQNVQLSAIRATLEQARKLESEGYDIIHLEMGEPDFTTPQHIIEAAKTALNEGKTHYASNRGLPRLRQVIAEKLKVENKINVDPEREVIVTVGAAEALFMAFAGTLNPQDEVIILEPAYVSYIQLARIVGAVPVIVKTGEKENWQADTQEIEKAISPRTRMIVVNSPNNPTGAVYDRAFLQAVADLAIQYNLLVVADEVYEKIIYSGCTHISIASLPGMRERTITINGYSKTYAMTGWRLAYVAADQKIIDALLKIHQYAATCVSTFSQFGAIAATIGSQQCVADMVNEFQRRSDLLYKTINQISGLSCSRPQGAFYAFFNIKETGMCSVDFVNTMQRKAGISVVPGTAFGESGEGYARISYASSYEVLEAALQRLSNTLLDLPKK